MTLVSCKGSKLLTLTKSIYLYYNKIILEGSIKLANKSENMVFFISEDKIIKHSTIRRIVHDVYLGKIEFKIKICPINNDTNLIILFNIKKTHNASLETEHVFDALTQLKIYCTENNIVTYDHKIYFTQLVFCFCVPLRFTFNAFTPQIQRKTIQHCRSSFKYSS